MPGTALALRPVCPSDPAHGFMELRDPPGGWTPEQRFCGIWYDCRKGPGHYASVLYQSPELVAFLAEQTVAHRAACPGCDRPACRGRPR